MHNRRSTRDDTADVRVYLVVVDIYHRLPCVSRVALHPKPIPISLHLPNQLMRPFSMDQLILTQQSDLGHFLHGNAIFSYGLLPIIVVRSVSSL
jgi:hypothetical protein